MKVCLNYELKMLRNLKALEREREGGERERETDTDTDFIVKANDPYTKGGGGTIAFLCLQSHNIIVEAKSRRTQ